MDAVDSKCVIARAFVNNFLKTQLPQNKGEEGSHVAPKCRHVDAPKRLYLDLLDLGTSS